MPMMSRRPHPTMLCQATALGLACMLSATAATRAAGEGGKPRESPNTRTVTFNKDIAPIVFQQCSSCHRPGEVAPFALLNYRDLSKRAKLIQSVTKDRIMPPWKAEAGGLHFEDERRLTDDQISLIDQWVQDGTPEGDAADLPAPPKFVDGWQLGEPDMVLKMEEAYSLAAEGLDEYRCFVIPFELPEGKYLKSVEYRPGNRKVVHHAVLTSLPHKVAEAKLKAAGGKSFGSGLAPPGQLLPGQLALWTPGMLPRPLPEGYPADFSKGFDLVLQLHLHPSGKPETEQSVIGLHFTSEKPKGRLRMMAMSNDDIDIPPGESKFELKTSMNLRGPVDLYGIFPHMHLIGRSVKITATLPDGTTQPIISIGDWDFNWQFYYQLATPLKLPAGTRLDGVWTYDNSAGNPANPSHPPKRVRFGEQTTNEMAIALLDVIPTGPSTGPLREAMKPEDASKRAIAFLRLADKDENGKLSLDEIVAMVGEREPRAELEKRLEPFDKNGDKQLDEKEIVEAIKALMKR
jgi:hypothetical protein